MLDVERIKTLFPSVDLDLVIVIYRQQMQRHVRRTSFRHRTDDAIRFYADLYRGGKSFFEIATCYANFSPYLLARILMQRLVPCLRQEVSKYVRNPSLIADERLRASVVECIEMDEFNSPYVDRIRRTLGLEYEYALQQMLLTAGIAFETEDALRLAGWSKTPDVKLSLPVSVQFRGKTRIINWVDSKAMFGDLHSFESENRKQLRGYVNRFGPGLVIYWFGFVETLNSDEDILVADSFPKNVDVLRTKTVRNETLIESRAGLV